jgi:hypothetical protein
MVRKGEKGKGFPCFRSAVEMVIYESLISRTNTVYHSLNHGCVLYCYSQVRWRGGYKVFGFERGMGFLFFLDNVDNFQFLTCIQKGFLLFILEIAYGLSLQYLVSRLPRKHLESTESQVSSPTKSLPPQVSIMPMPSSKKKQPWRPEEVDLLLANAHTSTRLGGLETDKKLASKLSRQFGHSEGQLEPWRDKGSRREEFEEFMIRHEILRLMKDGLIPSKEQFSAKRKEGMKREEIVPWFAAQKGRHIKPLEVDDGLEGMEGWELKVPEPGENWSSVGPQRPPVMVSSMSGMSDTHSTQESMSMSFYASDGLAITDKERALIKKLFREPDPRDGRKASLDTKVRRLKVLKTDMDDPRHKDLNPDRDYTREFVLSIVREAQVPPKYREKEWGRRPKPASEEEAEGNVRKRCAEAMQSTPMEVEDDASSAASHETAYVNGLRMGRVPNSGPGPARSPFGHILPAVHAIQRSKSPSQQSEEEKIDWTEASDQELEMLIGYAMDRSAYGGSDKDDLIAHAMNNLVSAKVLKKARDCEYTEQTITEAYLFIETHEKWSTILERKLQGGYRVPEQKRLSIPKPLTAAEKATNTQISLKTEAKRRGEKVSGRYAPYPKSKSSHPVKVPSMNGLSISETQQRSLPAFSPPSETASQGRGGEGLSGSWKLNIPRPGEGWSSGSQQSTKPRISLPPPLANVPGRGGILNSHGQPGPSQDANVSNLAGLSVSGVQRANAPAVGGMPKPHGGPSQHDNVPRMGEHSNGHGHPASQLPSLKKWNGTIDPTVERTQSVLGIWNKQKF